MVFLPINIKKCHWYLAVVNAKIFEVHVLDSMGLELWDRTDLKTTVKGLEIQIKFVLEHNKELNRVKWKNLDVSTWPLIEKIQERMQTDGTSCGLWMVNFMEYWTGSSLSDKVTQVDINNFRFKLPAMLWDSRLNIKNGYQELERPNDYEDSPSDVEIIDTTAEAPKPSARIFTDRKELLHRVSTYIWSIDDQECLDKEWVRSTRPYPISISLRTIRDILDANKPMDHDCFNMAVRTVACNIAWLFIEDKYHFMDLKFCAITQFGRDPRCCDKVDYKELAKLLECWPDMDYDIKDCSTVLLPYYRDRFYTLFIIDRGNKIVYIMDPHSPNLWYLWYMAKILPVVKNQHLLLCTLLICNAAAMEALPIFLDSLVTAWGAILISVTLILLFGEILPQSICSHYGLAIGASVAPLVRVLVWICFPIAYPISKLLDYVLGHGHTALFRRAELKTLVTLHGNEAGKGGELTHDETTIIAGALELTEKKAKDSMTPISQTFTIDINAKLDRELMREVLEKGHSRVPVYYEKKTNIIGLILVKNLLSINPDDEIPLKSVTTRKIPRVSEDMPLYDILNEFQKGHSHMAVVIRQTNPHYPAEQPVNDGETLEVSIAIDDKRSEKVVKNLPPLRRWKSYPNSQNSNRGSRSRKWSKDQSNVLQIHEEPFPTLSEDEEAIGIITMEDVIEELLQEEIYDETDVHIEEQ